MAQPTSSHASLDEGNSRTIGEKTDGAKPESEKHPFQSSELSGEASSTAEDTEKQEILEDDGDSKEEKGKDELQPPVEYPHGIEMFFIMLALVLSIVLCSIDQVSFPTPTLPPQLSHQLLLYQLYPPLILTL